MPWRRLDDDCLQELRWLNDRRDLAAWLAKWSGKYPKLTGWVEENIDEMLTFYQLPRRHHKDLNRLPRVRRSASRQVGPLGMVVSDRTKGIMLCSSEINPRTLTMTNLLNLTHITRCNVFRDVNPSYGSSLANHVIEFEH